MVLKTTCRAKLCTFTLKEVFLVHPTSHVVLCGVANLFQLCAFQSAEDCRGRAPVLNIEDLLSLQ